MTHKAKFLSLPSAPKFAFKDSDSKQFWLIVIGFSLFYTACVSFFYLPENPSFENALNGSIVLSCAILAAAVHLLGTKSLSKLLLIGHLMMIAAMAGIAFLEWNSEISIILYAVLAGVGMSFAAPLYLSMLAPFAAKRIATACGTMFFAGMLGNILLGLLPHTITLASIVVALILSLICTSRVYVSPSHAGSQNANSPSANASGLLDAFLIPVSCALVISIIYRIIDAVAVGIAEPSEQAILVSQFGGIAAAILFVMYYARQTRTSPSLLFNLVFGALATGILLLPFLPPPYAAALNIFAAAGWKLVMLALFFLVVTTYGANPIKLVIGTSLAWALPRGGLFVGSMLATFFGIDGTSDFYLLASIALFSLYAVLVPIWLASCLEKHRAESSAEKAHGLLRKYEETQNDIYDARCRQLAEQHALTEREQSILVLLARGRDLSFICSSLFLSKNTVKSYQRSIYTKLGVHSKQEIIDLVQSPNN